MANLEEFINIAVLGDIEEAEIDVNKKRIFHARDDPFIVLNDMQFKKEYRLTKEMTLQLITLLEPLLTPATRKSALNSTVKVLVALNFFAYGSYQQNIGKNVNTAISQSSVSRCIMEMIDVMNNKAIVDQFVKFPATLQELRRIQMGFYNKHSLPGIVGCIDCTHIAISAPTTNDPMYPEAIYINRKGYHSINVQLICDVNGKVLHVCAQYPGGTHDAHIWSSSDVNDLLQELHHRGHKLFLLGDSGYPLRPWLLTPIPNAEPDSPEYKYNQSHMQIRSVIERCNGILKSRFRCLLKHRVLHYHPERASKIINTCVMLHNFCIENSVPLPDLVDDINELGLLDFEVNDVNNLQEGHLNDLIAGRRLQQQVIQQHFV